ncbi:OmpA family protein [Vibrio sinensis]|uniref:OmpA family protein n=1 Tax=Vibrio sinensis TaxID=2302434 RepID=A0A3A6Q9D5_9VIBR|nr:OmpA family protein [Vibrio sinensis]RJX68436.1 OmpA family protein [Vibrio sinensis]
MTSRLVNASGVMLCLFSTLSYAQVDNDKLITVCGKPNVSIKQEVTIDSSTQVSLLQGGALRVESKGGLPPEQVLASEMQNLGIQKECVEYFVSQGALNAVDGRVYFDFASARLTPTSVAILDSLIEKIRLSPKQIELKGHTDSIGSKGYNFSLGLKRAESVQEYLVDQSVDKEKVKVTSFGETKPIASNNDAKGREKNRRVEIGTL